MLEVDLDVAMVASRDRQDPVAVSWSLFSPLCCLTGRDSFYILGRKNVWIFWNASAPSFFLLVPLLMRRIHLPLFSI